MMQFSHSHVLRELVNNNKIYVEAFKSSSLMALLQNGLMNKLDKRDKLLDCIQVFSNYFQKIIMLRRIFSERPPFLEIAQGHLSEEFNHDILLMKDRKNKAPVWDPILDAGAAWFVWKMFTLDNVEKTLVVHLILEESANIFFVEANKLMQLYGGTSYFSQHSELDQHHANMGLSLLNESSDKSLIYLFELQKQGWDVLNMICTRIAEIVIDAHKLPA